jgi:hypothetical protein
MTSSTAGTAVKAERSEADRKLDEFTETVMTYAGQAIHEAIAEHHRAGRPVVIMEDGEIVWWYPDGTKRSAEDVAQERAA